MFGSGEKWVQIVNKMYTLMPFVCLLLASRFQFQLVYSTYLDSRMLALGTRSVVSRISVMLPWLLTRGI